MNIDELRQIRTIVTHRYPDRICPDGVASAIILNDVFDEATTTHFVAHGSPEYRGMPATPGMLFVDIVPPEDRLQEFIDAGAFVLDHHEKQRDLVTAFGTRGVYSDEPGVSGAMLAFREAWLGALKDPESVAASRAHDFARLAGIRDTWQTASPDWVSASAQAEALSFYPWSYFARLRAPFAASFSDLNKMLQTGRVLLDRRDERTLRLIEQGSGRTVTHGVHVMIIPSIETSDVAEALGNAVEHAPDIVCGFAYQGGETIGLQLSMRSRMGYDVGALCKALGGGGHRAAAGVTIQIPKGGLNPYETIWQIVDDYEKNEHEVRT